MITEATRAAQIASQAIDPTLFRHPTLKERLDYKRFMDCEDVPVRVSPTIELEWVAFKLLRGGEVNYEEAPSKVAASWLRKLRYKRSKALKDKFWAETWPGYIDCRLGLELRSEVPRRGGRGVVLPSGASRLKNEGTISGLLKGENVKVADATSL
jgi:hypothetical protein